jgi:hypothetical protein
VSLEAEWQEAGEDIMILEIMTEDSAGGTVEEAELVEWADTYGLTMPVVSDPNSSVMWSFATGGSVGLPYTVLIDQGMVVETVGGGSIDEAVGLAGR